MKIICRTKIIKDDPWLEIGQMYYPLAISLTLKEGVNVFIQSGKDKGPIWEDLSGFEIVDQIIPSSWVAKSYAPKYPDIVKLMPASWTNGNFFEALSDYEEDAVKLFNYEATKIYEELEVDQ